MSVLIRRFRDWWQPPRKAGNRLEHRQVTFLELIFDLVNVVIIVFEWILIYFLLKLIIQLGLVITPNFFGLLALLRTREDNI